MFQTTWRSPSNIAFVKYWGKIGHQIPANPSLSMTLKECFTETKVTFEDSDKLQVKLFLDGVEEEKFALKIRTYLEKLDNEKIMSKSLVIHTHNTFPHGTGIASSASGLSAFALCLTDYLYHLEGKSRDDSFYQMASNLSRLASGSACRSIYGGFTSWGKSELPFSSDFYATPLSVHPQFHKLRDSVVIFDENEKKVSSRAGHERMNFHPFSQARFQEAKLNFERMNSALRSGDIDEMGLILENEALQLHAMMMTSPHSYLLLKPNTLVAIELVRDFRSQTKLPVYFTLDAGPNLHLIYPDACNSKVSAFIQHELGSIALKIIDDQCGEGPSVC